MHKFLLVVFTLSWLASSAFAQKQLFQSEKESFITTILTKTLENPWSMAELDQGRFLISLKKGNFVIFSTLDNTYQAVKGTVNSVPNGQGGLLDVVLDPNFASNNLVYFTFTGERNRQRELSLGSAKLQNYGLFDVKTLFTVPSKSSFDVNIGGGLLIVGDKLYMSTGDRFQARTAQDLNNLQGKVLVFPLPNAATKAESLLPTVFTYGNRNPQGLFYDNATKNFWEVEHGPAGGDEVNLLLANQNYGWPLVSFGLNYDGSPVNRGESTMPGVVPPRWHWTPSSAPSSLIVYQGSLFPNWQGNIFVSMLRGQYLSRLTVEDGKVLQEERLLLNEFGRIRKVYQAKNSKIYLLTDSKDGYLIVLERKD